MPAKSITIAGLQMLVTNNVAANEEKILHAIPKAAKDNADFLLTPEASLSGYRSDFDRVEVEQAVRRVAQAARKAKVGLALGTCYKELAGSGEYCYNQVRLYTSAGRYLGYHAKILRGSPLNRPGTGEMRAYVEGTLRTFDSKGVRFGVLICNDMWAGPHCTTMPNPHLALQLRHMGARFILHAINSGTDKVKVPYHESAVALIAMSNHMPIVEVNAAKPGRQAVNAASGLVGPDGERKLRVPYVGEHYFKCVVPLS